MKTTLASFIFLVVCGTALAQENSEKDKKDANTNRNKELRRRGYIGLTLGPSFPLGEFASRNNMYAGGTGKESAGTGLQLTIINFGYLFTPRIGVAASWFGAAYSHTSEFTYGGPDLGNWSCGGIMLGPLFSFPISEKIELDLRTMMGRSVCSGTSAYDATIPNEFSNSDIVVDVGTVFRINMSKTFSALLTADYFSTQMKFPSGRPEQPIKAFSLGFGLAFRFR